MNSNPDKLLTPASSENEAAERTRALVAALWKRSQPVVAQRVALLEEAARSAQAGQLTTELRLEACAAAHKLAGSLGMFGYPLGTDLARALEAQLDRDDPEPATLAAKTASLRALLFP